MNTLTQARALTLASLAAAAPTMAQTVTELPIPVPASFVRVTDVNSDGTIIAGSYAGAYPDQIGYIYDRTTGHLTDLGVIATPRVLISDDGTVAASNVTEPLSGASAVARWTQATNSWEILWITGTPCSGSISTVFDLSADGNHIVGSTWLGCGPGAAAAFRWDTINGEEILWGSRAAAISDDGRKMTGFDRPPTGGRIWANWDSSQLSWPTPEVVGEGQAISSDGSVMAGMQFREIARYTDAGGMEILGAGQSVLSLSDDGDALLALSAYGLEYWTPAVGYVRLADFLGSAFAGYAWIYFPSGVMSGDGKTIVANAVIGSPIGGTPVVLVIEPESTSCPCACDFDTSTGAGVCDIFDFLALQNSFVNAETCACDIDTSTGSGVCDIFDFLAFQNAFVGGCP